VRSTDRFRVLLRRALPGRVRADPAAAPGEPVEVFWEEEGCVRRRVVRDLDALLGELRRPGVTDLQVRTTARPERP
jgi:hypothetical protein